MNATRRGDAAIIAALLLLVVIAALLTIGRPLARQIAYGLGIVARPHMARAGEPLRPLAVTALDGSNASISGGDGHPMLINVFATWCTPCREETPGLAQAAPMLSKAGIRIVGIDQAESSAQVARFASLYDLHYPLYIDAHGLTQTALAARVIPTTLLVDKNGVIRFIHSGPLPASTFLAAAHDMQVR